MIKDNSLKLRCHMIFGPPSSGKSTLAKYLALKINAQIISTDSIRKELYGDESIQGDWENIESIMQDKIIESINQNKSVILDATFAKRPWRLEITQNLILNKNIEWIGWFLKTGLENCLIWNQKRDRKVPEEIINNFYTALSNSNFGPNLAEGFASIIEIFPNNETQLKEDLDNALNSISKKITQRKNKEMQKDLHGYSRLLDLERLLYLMQLLTFFPGLEANDKLTKAKMESICNPLPQGSMGVKASIILKEWKGKCYSDINKIEQDLEWLNSQGFIAKNRSSNKIKPPEINFEINQNLGGWHFMAEKEAFVRVMTLIRFIIHNPHSFDKGVRLHDHLIEKLGDVYLASETSKIRKDIEKILTPYGFRNKNDNTRHGYGLGAAILSINRLDDLFKISSESAKRLDDTFAYSLNKEISERFKWAGIKAGKSTRIFANKSIVNPSLIRADSVAYFDPKKNINNIDQLEDAIRLNQLIEIEFFSSSAKFEKSEEKKFLLVWPLQIIFHNIGWYLAYEKKELNRKGLIETVRMDRISLRRIDSNQRRSDSESDKRISNLKKLIEVSGGIYFGKSIDEQMKILNSKDESIKDHLLTLRFRAKEYIYKFLREGLQRYPSNQIRISLPNASDKWKPPENAIKNFSLKRIENDDFPYPIEIDLPSWTLEADIDFKRWILGFRDGIKIESPKELLDEIKKTYKDLNDLYN